jgi:cytochrome c oxidase subunit 3
MGAIILFLAVIATIIGWWLSHQRLTAKPWLEEGPIGEVLGTGASTLPPAKIGLVLLFAVIGALFALLISAYLMRRNMADWRTLPVPNLLWSNTAALIASSVALEWARVAARRRWTDDAKIGLLVGGAFAIVFLIGQTLVWRQLNAAGYFLASNPANAFFFLMIALHGMHLSGGLIALYRTTVRMWNGESIHQIRLSIQLCAMYWHFLLLIWLVLLALLTRSVDEFVTICSQLFW